MSDQQFSLTHLILIDSYKPGAIQEIRLDGHSNLNGVNGAGKTTLLRLIPLFFGERPGRLVPRNRVTDSFARHYLPNESSYIIFQYQRGEQSCLTVIYASPNEEGLCYRFVDKAFEQDDFIVTGSDGSLMPVSCRNLGRHLLNQGAQCSNQISSCLDYRTVIQNLPHKKGQEIRNLIARYSFCQSATGQRLKDIEKIVSGMLMRSTDFDDLREMLVNCIDENRDAIALEVQMETLDGWHKEYRAFQEIEAERNQADELGGLENKLQHLENDLIILRQRLRLLLESAEDQRRKQRQSADDSGQQLETLIEQWNLQEQTTQSQLATINAELQEAQRHQNELERERDDWDKKDVHSLRQIRQRLPHIKSTLAKEQANLTQLKQHVQDIEAEFGRLKAEKENQFQQQLHQYDLAIGQREQRAAELKAEAQEGNDRQKESLRRQSAQEQEAINLAIGDLRQQLGELNGKIAEIQPDPALLESRELKIAEQQALQQQKQMAEQALQSVENDIRQHRREIDQVINQQMQCAEQQQTLTQTMAHLRKQLDADPDTLLGFLRENRPDWVNNTAKVINPQLLLRDDLEPSLTDASHTLYGLDLNLEVLSALKQQLKSAIEAVKKTLAEDIGKINAAAERDIQHTQQQIKQTTEQKQQALEELAQQRLSSLQARQVDTKALTRLETNIQQLQAEQVSAEQAKEILQDYQRWLDKEWSRHPHWQTQAQNYLSRQQQLQHQFEQDKAHYQNRRSELQQILKELRQILKQQEQKISAINQLLDDLRHYPDPTVAEIVFDPSHTLSLLQNDYRRLKQSHQHCHQQRAQLVSHFKRLLAKHQGSQPARYYASIEADIGIDGADRDWSSAIQNWYQHRYLECRKWLVMQAQNFGSAIRNYQQALDRFDRGIDSLSRRLAKHIDNNIRFEKIESIQGRLSSKVGKLGYWEQIVQFTRNFDEWSRSSEGAVPDNEFAEVVRLVSEQLQGKGRVEMKLVNLLELEIIVTENGRSKRATHADELRQISSHGLSYLILCVFFIALVNMIRKDQPLNIIWPMDELKELHQMNIELLIDILNQNRITLFSAFPDPDPDVLSLFKNRYQVVGNRELVEMTIDDDYLLKLPPLNGENAHV